MNQDENEEIPRHKQIKKNIEDSKLILAELSQIGIYIDWIDDLYNKRINYKNAVPVLLKWLPIVKNPNIKESIVRALSVPWARKTNASMLMINEFRKESSNSSLRWAIGNALSVIAEDDVLDEVITLLKDKTYGKSREMLVLALGNMKKSEVEDILIELLEDEELAGFAIMILGKKKSKKARQHIERYLTVPKTWVRREAIKAIKRIDR